MDYVQEPIRSKSDTLLDSLFTPIIENGGSSTTCHRRTKSVRTLSKGRNDEPYPSLMDLLTGPLVGR